MFSKLWLFRLLVIISSPLIIITILELIARIIYQPSKLESTGIFEYHPTKVFTLKPNHNGPFAGKSINTNSYGYRDSSFRKTKNKNEIRILCLGDSVTFGDGVENHIPFPNKLENLLNSNYSNIKFQVINAGVPGNGPMQEYYDLKNGLDFEPDAVVLQFTLNDVTEPFIFLKRLGGSGWSYHGVRDIPAIDFYLGQHSALYILAKNWYAKMTYQGEEEDTLKERAIKQEIYQKEKLITLHDNVNIKKAWDEYFDWLRKISDICRDNQLPLIILISPFEFQFKLSSNEDYPQQIIMEFCKQNGITNLNLIDNLRTEFLSQNLSFSNEQQVVKFWDQFFHDHDHYSEFGHKYVADLLFPHIVRKLNLSQ